MIAVPDVERARELFRDLFGLKFEITWVVPHEKVKVRSERIASTQLQFIQATSPDGVVAKFLESKGEGLNHIAFKVTNLKELVKKAKEKGVKFIPEEPIEYENPDIPVGEGSFSYIFVHPQSACGTLIELMEPKR